MFEKIKNLHFVGIGGSGMSGIAELMKNVGYRVSGSDVIESGTVARLRKLGIRVFIGHDKANISGAQVVVVSSAIGEDNPEVIEALKNEDVSVIKRAEMLAELMRLKYGIAVSGTHGKTTTTSMIAHVLSSAGMDPTMVIGGRFGMIGSGAKLGKGDFLVAEADESDGSFLKLCPAVSVVTNIDNDHLDYYGSIENIKKSFAEFCDRVPFYGFCVMCFDDANTRSVSRMLSRKHISYGASADCNMRAYDVVLDNGLPEFSAEYRGKKLGRFKLRVAGMHNVLNSIAAVTVATELGVGRKKIRDALNEFAGVDRRFQLKGNVNGITVVDDYGHHPSEIKATLKSAKMGWKMRTVVVFQPHRYSRTKLLYREFAESFNDADVLILTEIYPAGEKKIENVSTSMIYKIMKRKFKGILFYAKEIKDAVEILAGETKKGDMVITLGAGDVHRAGEMFLEMVKNGK